MIHSYQVICVQYCGTSYSVIYAMLQQPVRIFDVVILLIHISGERMCYMMEYACF